jgi:PAS domain S-box-containing protein
MDDRSPSTAGDVEIHRVVLERLSVGVVAVRPGDGSIVYANPAFTRMLGYEPDQLTGRPISIVNAPVDTSPEARADAIMAHLHRHGRWSGEIANRHRDGSIVWCQADVREFDDPVWGTVWLGEHHDVTEHKRMAEALTESEARLQAIVDNTTAVIYVKDLDGRYLLVNRRFEELFHVSRRDARNRADHDIFPAAFADTFRANDIAVAHAGHVFEFDETVPQDDGDHTYISIKFPLRRATGEVYATCGISTDITERVRSRAQLQEANELLEQRVAERTAALRTTNQRLQEEIVERQRSEARKALLMSELDHRVKNALATAVALADGTLEHCRSLDEFRGTFLGRIRTMARSHEVLARAQWQGVDIVEMASLVLAPFEAARTGRVRVDGASAQLAASAALPICLTLHELGTNAIKHGALSVPSGRLHVAWRVLETGRLALDWVERDGPRVSPPSHVGSGLQIVRDLLVTQLGSTMETRFDPEGFTCHVEIPLSARVPAGCGAAPLEVGTTAVADPLPVGLDGLRVLVLEDDRLQANLVARWLTRIGCHVVGPALNTTDALRLLRTERIDAAVLDVNLAGRSSEPVAEELEARHLGFVFITGYGDGGILGSRFSAIPRLVKPIDPGDLERALHRIARPA